MIIVGVANTALFTYLLLESGEPAYKNGVLLVMFTLAVTFTAVVNMYLREIHGWSRLAQWLLTGVVYALVYPPCLVWNLLTLPLWFRTYRGLRWYYFTSSGAVEYMGETRFIRLVSKLDDYLGHRVTYGRSRC
jgi:hypothetical protein